MKEEPAAVPQKKSLVPVLIALLVAFLGTAVLCGGIVVALLAPAIQHAREAERRRQAAENLRQVSEALRNYHESWETNDAVRQDTEKNFDRAFEQLKQQREAEQTLEATVPAEPDPGEHQ